jgi:hypothetical protein
VSTFRLSNDQLNTLRTRGDHDLEGRLPPDADYFSRVATDGLVQALNDKPEMYRLMRPVGNAAFEHWRLTAPDRFDVDATDLWPQIQMARRLFVKYGDDIAAALLLAGLPELYATAWGAPVLVAHGDLVWHVQRRIRQTAQFLLDVLSGEQPSAEDVRNGREIDSGTERLRSAAVAIRYFHQRLREQLSRDPELLNPENKGRNTPVNQEDLLGTLLTFTVTVFRVFSALGIELTADEEEAYLLLWDLVGEIMGIGGEAARATVRRPRRANAKAEPAERWLSSIRPSCVADATRLLAKMHARQWIQLADTLDVPQARLGDLPSDSLNAGRILTKALLDNLTEAMPPTRRPHPRAVMRTFAPDVVRQRLALTGGGLLDLAWRKLPARRWRSDPRTTFETPNRIGAMTLRIAAGDIARHAFLAFIDADGPPFEFPGLDFDRSRRASKRPQDNPAYLGTPSPPRKTAAKKRSAKKAAATKRPIKKAAATRRPAKKRSAKKTAATKRPAKKRPAKTTKKT